LRGFQLLELAHYRVASFEERVELRIATRDGRRVFADLRVEPALFLPSREVQEWIAWPRF